MKAGKTEKILLALTAVFLGGLLWLDSRDRAAAGPVTPELPAAQEDFLPDLSLVDLNTASVEELDRLPGIGPALAGKIVKYREAQGPFESIEELAEVPGIGEQTVAGLREDATVERKDQLDENSGG